MKKILYIFLALGLLASCKKEDIMTFEADKPMLNFIKSKFTPEFAVGVPDTLTMDAVFFAGQDEVDFKLPVYMSGKIVDVDRYYEIKMVADKLKGDIKEGEHYTLPEKQVLRAGQYRDSAIVRINIKKLRQDELSGTVVFEIVPGKEFSKGIDLYRSIGIHMSGRGFLEQPQFWFRNNLEAYGGVYSSIKAEKYVELNSIPNDDWRESNLSVLYVYAKRTYEWFKNNPTLDEDGQPIKFEGEIKYE